MGDRRFQDFDIGRMVLSVRLKDVQVPDTQSAKQFSEILARRHRVLSSRHGGRRIVEKHDRDIGIGANRSQEGCHPRMGKSRVAYRTKDWMGPRP